MVSRGCVPAGWGASAPRRESERGDTGIGVGGLRVHSVLLLVWLLCYLSRSPGGDSGRRPGSEDRASTQVTPGSHVWCPGLCVPAGS